MTHRLGRLLSVGFLALGIVGSPPPVFGASQRPLNPTEHVPLLPDIVNVRGSLLELLETLAKSLPKSVPHEHPTPRVSPEPSVKIIPGIPHRDPLPEPGNIFELIARNDNDHQKLAASLGVPVSQLSVYEKPAQPPPIGGIAVIPTDQDSFQATFGSRREAGSKDLEAASTAKAALSDVVETDVRKLPRTVAEFEAKLRSSDAAVFTVIGHNDDGFLIIPPKDRLPLKEMSTVCKLRKRFCLFISCKSSTYVGRSGVTGNVTFFDAVQIAYEINRAADAAIQQKRSELALLEGVLITVEKTRDTQKASYGIYIVPAAIVGGGIGLLLIDN